MIVVLGLAAGRGSTEGAARGAFTIRKYKDQLEAKAHEGDWLKIISAQPEDGPTWKYS